MVRIAICLCAALLMLTSCIEVNEQVTVNGDGSGVVELTYRVARVATELPPRGNARGAVPLPVNPSEFRSEVLKANGLSLKHFTPLDEVDTVGVTASIGFQSVNNLDQLLTDPGSFEIALHRSASASTFIQQLYPGNPNGVDPDTLALVEDLFGSYTLAFSLKSPKPIQRVNLGTVSKDKMTATYTTTIPDIIQSKSPVSWEVSW